MDSEKVKEIKNNIIICSNKIECKGCSLFPNMKSTNCRNKLLADALTLINELESENERLLEQRNKTYNIWVKDTEKLKDRIAELEKENALIKNSVAMRDYKTLEEISNNKVKEFAEKLKNKLFEFFQDNEELDGKISVGPLYVDVIGVEAKDGTIISLGLIDKLLKEYEK